ncbi:MAG: tRNA epoxyqueuosine(34) reductase QueG [Fimbriimonadaceae bacterium]
MKFAAHSLGFELVGVCDSAAPHSLGILEKWVADGMHGEMEYMSNSLPLRADLNSVLSGVRSVIAVGLNYYQVPFEGDVKVARYAVGRDYHKVIRGKLKRLGSAMAELVPEETWRACVDSAPVMEREYANRAGLGWFGKNTCLINSYRGSWFLIGVLLTTAEIAVDPAAVGGCGTCTRCVDDCPTGAIVLRDEVWQVDARQCISYLTIEKRGDFTAEEAGMVGDWTFGCDVCQEVCPFNQDRPSQPLRGLVTTEPGFLDRRDFGGLEEILVWSEEEWDKRTRGSAVRRAGFDGLRRNARANLGRSTD